jgi:hypothetical protein
MSFTVDKWQIVARKILARLDAAGPLRVRDCWKQVVQDSAEVGKALKVFYWLRDKGYIRKVSDDYCSPYELTERGKQFLAALT